MKVSLTAAVQLCKEDQETCLNNRKGHFKMGKITDLGLVPKDDPMFLNGPQLFSRRESNRSTTTSASATDGAAPAQTSKAPAQENLEKKRQLAEKFAKMTPEQLGKLYDDLM